MVKHDHTELYELVQKQAGIVNIISSHIPLTESRRGMKGNCPFHDDHATSLMVSPEKNIFKCFGCGQEGGPAEFLARISGVTQEHAVELLAGSLNSQRSA